MAHTADKETQTPPCPGSETKEDQSSQVVIAIPKWLLLVVCALTGLAVSFFIVDMYLASLQPRFYVPPEIMEDLGVEGVIMFRQHDRDSDGVLNLQEFEPLAHRLLEINETYIYDLKNEEGDEVLSLQAFLEPLQLSSMSKDMDARFPGLDPLHGLKRWKKVDKERIHIAARHFSLFLPEDRTLLESVGEVYRLIGLPEDMGPGATFSSNRYTPPRLIQETDILVHKLLTMFHPRPFVMSRFQPHGSVAVIRAFNKDIVDIVFRIHAEFQLNEAPFQPFWFSLAQFAGNLIINRHNSHVFSFNMYVPTERKLNVDMEWLTGPFDSENMEVDIGYIPQMSINSTGPSVPVTPDTSSDTVPPSEDDTATTYEWTAEISREEAAKKLELKMYPFKKIPYYNITEAFDTAEAEGKLVHHIILWGAMDDQSC